MCVLSVVIYLSSLTYVDVYTHSRPELVPGGHHQDYRDLRCNDKQVGLLDLPDKYTLDTHFTAKELIHYLT